MFDQQISQGNTTSVLALPVALSLAMAPPAGAAAITGFLGDLGAIHDTGSAAHERDFRVGTQQTRQGARVDGAGA